MEKGLNDFYKDSSRQSGFRSNCKTCQLTNVKTLQQKYLRLETRDTKDKKVCGRCKEEKPVTEFIRNRYQKDGLTNDCRECRCEYSCAYTKARKQYDPKFKLAENLRTRLWAVLKGKSKSQTTRQVIGVDIEIFRKWIYFQLEEGMTKENYGSVWHIDHVIPLASFNLLDEDELQKAMNWKNLRPLTPFKNMEKSNKIDRWLYVLQEVKAAYFLKHLDEL